MENLADFLFENLKFTPKDFGFDKKESPLVNARASMACSLANENLKFRITATVREMKEWENPPPSVA